VSDLNPLLGLTPDQAMNLKKILVNALLKDSKVIPHKPKKLVSQTSYNIPELDPQILSPSMKEEFLSVIKEGMAKFSN
jgi:hypothetical protein